MRLSIPTPLSWQQDILVRCLTSTTQRIEHLETFKMEQLDLDRIATALERIAEKLDHLHIDAIDHNHVEGDVNTHAKTW